MVDSFFVTKKGSGKRKRTSQNTPDKNNAKPKNTKQGASSDEASDDELGPGGIDDMDLMASDVESEEEIEETPAEKRLRLAKKYIDNLRTNLGTVALYLYSSFRLLNEVCRNCFWSMYIQIGVQYLIASVLPNVGNEDEFDAADVDKDLISERLQQDALEASGRLHRALAHQFVLPVQENAIRKQRGHQLSVTSVAITVNKKFVFTGSKDGSIIKWDVADGKKVHTFPGGRKGVKGFIGHTDHILSLAVSSDGKYLASGGKDKLINIWSINENKHLVVFKHHKDTISGLAFRKGSNQLYSCSNDRSIKLWNIDELSYVETLFGHQDTITDIDTLSRENCVTCGGRDRTVRLWKIIDETQLVFRGGGGKRDKASGTAFVEGSIDVVSLIDEETFLSGSDSGTISLWSTTKKKAIFTLPVAHGIDELSQTPRWITSIASLKYSDVFATGSWDGQIRLWKLGGNLRNFAPLATIPMPGVVNALNFNHDISMTSTNAILVAGVGQEHKLGRWLRVKEAKNGVAIIEFTLDKSSQPAAAADQQ
ncbi:pre-rRNA processing protein [Basidiobolus ranarum]|uniref:Pre-rRNA processing protein n=1 Tax=Basidiobolus ranarum TaxID=34480 RepID=A0ABR2VUV8_9FUNG